VLAVAVGSVLIVPAASRAATNGPVDRSQTVDVLRFHDSVAQLDALFRSLPEAAMPGNVTARGWVRCRLPGCENQQGNTMLNDPIVPFLWKGQVWRTDASGGTMTNRTANDTRRDFPAVASYGASFLDGRPAIVVTYPSDTNPYPVSHLILNCRAPYTGVYLCYVFLDSHPLSMQKVLLFNVIEDTTNPN
jgi:hypothetical protein